MLNSRLFIREPFTEPKSAAPFPYNLRRYQNAHYKPTR
jgi:hypothetical protein